MKQHIERYFPIFTIATFAAIKLSTLHVRASDSNIYFYTAKKILDGELLYRDIFFTNFPLVPYVASFYFLISQGNLLFYFATAFIEVTGCSILIFLIINQTHKTICAIEGIILFLFSFIILSTSQHQTGIFLSCLFILISYFLYQKQQFLLVGVFTGLALLTKAYTLPLFATYAAVLLLQQKRALPKFLLGFFATVVIILLPTLLLSFQDFIKEIFFYSLSRSQGLSKTTILWFTIKHDPLIVLIALLNIAFIRKKLFFGLFSIFSILFFLLYKDTYYLYFVVMIPILIISFPDAIKNVCSYISINRSLISTVIIAVACINTFVFFSGYQNLQDLNINEMTSAILRHDPPLLYGVNGITPAIALSSKKPLLNDVIDTNVNIFNKGYLNANKMTDDLIKVHGLFITEGIHYPELGIDQPVYTTIGDQEKIKKYCKNVSSFPFRSEGVSNIINFFQC